MESCVAQTCASAATAGPSAFLFSQLIQALLVAQCSITSQQNYPIDRTQEILDQKLDFDFIIAGGGSAGSVLASRLSENPNWRVLLIERGDDPSLLSDVPGLILLLQHSPEDYDYQVEPNEYSCLGMQNKQCVWAKGKALGGSSVINAMLYVRGTEEDFDRWEEMGNPGWGYKDVLPYFLKLENYHPDVVAKYGADKFGTGGPLTLRPYNYSLYGLHETVLGAAEELGIPILDMLNGDRYVGFGKAYGNVENGVRQNVAKAYLNPVRDRKNLYVIKSTRVDSVLFDGHKRATGVKVTLKNGRQAELRATKEVIVSAGAIASPQILMLSGIGPREELEKHNIEVIADLPVGKHLQNHLIWMGVHLVFANKTARAPNSHLYMLDWAYEYLLHRKGEFASAGGVDVLGFVNTKDPSAKYPNLQFHFVQMPQNQAMKIAAVAKAFNFADDLVTEMLQSNSETDSIMVGPTLLHPKTAGQLKLKSTNPQDQIEIHAPFFNNQEDVDLMLEGLDIVRKMVETKVFKDLDVKLRRFNIAGCVAHPTDSREYWECNLRHTTATVYHPTGTCKMGPNSQDSVVDIQLKVHGVDGLRVVDASVMPEITSGNTHAPVLMIAEKASDIIKKEWLAKIEL